MEIIKSAIRFSVLSVGAILYGHVISTLGANVNVTAGFYFFSPQNVTINTGDSVTWTGLQAGGHTVTSTTGLWPSGSSDGFTFTFNDAGTYNYFCIPHQSLGMVGSVTVNAASATVNHQVTTSGFTFVPSMLTINAGDSVTWVNLQSGGHTTTSANSLWSSSSDGFTFTFPDAGTFNYYCIPHRSFGMVGSITVNAAAPMNTPPTVSITSPVSGSVFAAPASVTVQASAADNDGTVAGVQFLLGSTVLANETAAPFSTVASDLAAGNYTLSAIATDNLGAKATNSVSIIVDALPTVTITHPASGIVLSAPASLNLTASAADSDGSVTNVQFWQGTTLLGDVATAPFSMPVSDLAAASYTFSAIASDNNGLTTTNSITVDVINPSPLAIGGAPAVASPGHFQFSYATDLGLSYIVQVSTNLLTWTTIATNSPATVNPAVFTDTQASGGDAFYRVARLPNP